MISKKNEKQVLGLQVVEIDQSKFAIQMMDGNISVNLTKMAKPFGKSKQPSNWLKTKESKEYINTLSVPLKVGTADLLSVRHGGDPDEQGTWANDYRLAMRFAQWLSPEFAIKVDEMLVNQLLKRSIKKPVVIPQNAGYVENQLFLNKLGEGMTYCYYTNGVLFTKLSPVFKLFGSAGSVSPTHKERIGMENLMQIEVGKQLTWFGNINAIEIFLKYAKTQIKYSAISTVYRDIFGIERSRDIEDPYVYHFTSMQMLEIFELIFDKPINKEKVISKLRCGKLEAGYEK